MLHLLAMPDMMIRPGCDNGLRSLTMHSSHEVHGGTINILLHLKKHLTVPDYAHVGIWCRLVKELPRISEGETMSSHSSCSMGSHRPDFGIRLLCSAVQTASSERRRPMACVAFRVASYKTVTESEATKDHARLLVCGIPASPFSRKAQSGQDLDFERQPRSLYVPRGGNCRSRT